MKRLFIFSTLLVLLFNVFSASAGSHNHKIQIRTLNTFEAQSQLRPSQLWIEINFDEAETANFKILDRNGVVQKIGNLKNGKALVDLSILPLGRYEVIFQTGTNTTTQSLEIL